MAKPFITIIGLGATGTSVGLALRKEPGEFDVVGHDKSANADTEAKRLGAVDRMEWNLHRAVEGSSLVILALPLHEVEETLTHIAEDLAPETLLLALNPLLLPLVETARRTLPNHARFIAGHPIRKIGVSSATASADAFAGAPFTIAADAHTDPAAMELASDFVERVGAHAHFTDPLEHDGVMALVEQLPQIVGASLVSLSHTAYGWRESRQLAGRRYAQSTELGTGAEQLYRAFLHNRENLARRLGELQGELARWQQLLEEETENGDEQPLLDALKQATEDRRKWEELAGAQKWQEADPTTAPAESPNSLFRQLFLGNIGRKKPPTNGQPNNQ